MKKVRKLEASSIYIMEGRAAAKNLFFESDKDIEYVHRLVRRYFDGMLDVLQYQFGSHGWKMLIKTRSEQEIEASYWKQRSKSNQRKLNPDAVKTKESEMISEHIRYFLSMLVRTMNRRTGRKGSKVERVFSRYIFESKEEYEEYMKEGMYVDVESDQNERYRAKEDGFEGDCKDRGEEIRSSFGRKAGRKRFGKVYLIDLQTVTEVVLDKFLKNAIKQYFTNSSYKNTQNSEISQNFVYERELQLTFKGLT